MRRSRNGRLLPAIFAVSAAAGGLTLGGSLGCMTCTNRGPLRGRTARLLPTLLAVSAAAAGLALGWRVAFCTTPGAADRSHSLGAPAARAAEVPGPLLTEPLLAPNGERAAWEDSATSSSSTVPRPKSGGFSYLGPRASSFTVLAALPVLKAVTVAARGISQVTGFRSSALQRRAQAKEDIMGETTKVVLPVLGILVVWIALMYAIQHSFVAVPFLAPGQAVYFPIIATFLAGYAVIIFEEQTEINKAATALVLGVLVWALVGTGLDLNPAEFSRDIKDTLEDVAEVVFFLLGALTIVEIMDAHKGFDIITNSITATKTRDLLLVIGILTFLLSSVLNNLTVVIVMVSLIQKLVKDVQLRQRMGGIIVVASNAGGAWTPIGDITTTMLYIGGQVTAVPLLVNLVVPSVLCLVGTLGYEYLRMDADARFERPSAAPGEADDRAPEGQALVFWGGLLGMVTVPVFSAVTQCPPWSGMMLVLGLLGVITSLLHEPNDERYSLKGALTRVEVPDCLFFLGVLFAVGGLERVGLLKAFAVQLSQLVPTDAIVAVLLGFASSVVDNVPLVAATQGMYDLTAHPANDGLWNLITYCAATGGSLLVIGSAAGVAFMGMEKGVSFGWYTKEIAPAALIGYFFGVGGILAQQALGLTLAS